MKKIIQTVIKKSKTLDKKIIIAAIAAIIVLVLGSVVYYVFNGIYQGLGVAKNDQQEKVVPGDLNKTPEQKGSGVALIPLGASGEKLSYEEALSIYKYSGYLMQFTDCKTKPGSLTMKTGNSFMIDNRDSRSVKIVIQGEREVSLAAYGFAIIGAPVKEGAHSVTCDNKTSANINVSK